MRSKNIHLLWFTSVAPSVELNDSSQVDILDARYKSTSVGAEKSPVSPHRRTQIGRKGTAIGASVALTGCSQVDVLASTFERSRTWSHQLGVPKSTERVPRSVPALRLQAILKLTLWFVDTNPPILPRSVSALRSQAILWLMSWVRCANASTLPRSVSALR